MKLRLFILSFFLWFIPLAFNGTPAFSEDGEYLSEDDKKFEAFLETNKNHLISMKEPITYLSVGKKIFPVHKVQIGLSCRYFQLLLTNGMRESTSNDPILIKDIDNDHLLKILRLIYHKEYDPIAIAQTIRFLSYLNYFGLDHFSEKVLLTLKQNNDIEQMRTLFIQAEDEDLPCKENIYGLCKESIFRTTQQQSLEEMIRFLGPEYFKRTPGFYYLMTETYQPSKGDIEIEAVINAIKTDNFEVLQALIIKHKLDINLFMVPIEWNGYCGSSCISLTKDDSWQKAPLLGTRGHSLLLTAIYAKAQKCAKGLLELGANPFEQYIQNGSLSKKDPMLISCGLEDVFQDIENKRENLIRSGFRLDLSHKNK